MTQASTPDEEAAIGRQGRRTRLLFLETTDFATDHQAMLKRGVRFCEEPRKEPDGTVRVFEDLSGNRWDLLEPSGA